MDIKIQEIEDNFIKFIISGVDFSFVNSVRRSLIADIPKMAIEDVEIHLGAISDDEGKTYESTTPLFDEIISHRLGLVPIPTDLEILSFKDECDCGGEGCVNCSIMYSLNKRGPCTVYSGDLEPLGDDNLRPRDAKIPIVKLTEAEGILIYATAVMGTAKEHAKWQGIHAAGYKQYPVIEIDNKKCDHGGACISYCPVDVFVKEGKKVKVANPENCTMCMSCVEVCEMGAVAVDHIEDKFIFRFETDGALFAKDALLHTLTHLGASFDNLIEMVDTMKPKEYKPVKAVKKVFDDDGPVEVPGLEIKAKPEDEEAEEEEPAEETDGEPAEAEAEEEPVEEVEEDKPKKKAAKKTTKKAAKKK